jgi:hypothetical protein
MPIVLALLEQHSVALVVLWSVTAMLSWLIARNKSPVRDGLDVRFLGRSLIIVAVAAALLSHAPLAFSLAVSLLGWTLSVLGARRFRSANRSRLQSSTSAKVKGEV